MMGQPAVDCVLDIRAGSANARSGAPKEQALYWVDIYEGRLNRFDPSTGANRVWTLPEPIGSFALVPRRRGACWRSNPACGAMISKPKQRTALAQPEAHLPRNRLNDGRCDRQGRFWIGSMEDPVNPTQAARRALPFRCRSPLHAGGRADFSSPTDLPSARMAASSIIPIHIAAVRTIWAWDLDPDDGVIGNRRVFVDTHGMPGRPDGGAVDADGCYWMAANDGWEIVRFTPDGRVDRRIKLPVAKPSMLAFGGPKLDTIYITSIRPVFRTGRAAAWPAACLRSRPASPACRSRAITDRP